MKWLRSSEINISELASFFVGLAVAVALLPEEISMCEYDNDVVRIFNRLPMVMWWRLAIYAIAVVICSAGSVKGVSSYKRAVEDEEDKL
ncbi:MAG: hypothetical protein MASP_01702 [Candidatus Methanolliviera sp. GoM_asphalt]|nr:MAG: hypothetical protein MASP_01702 [Candidatus Methanolliviera sp. GoM_asphalt]